MPTDILKSFDEAVEKNAKELEAKKAEELEVQKSTEDSKEEDEVEKAVEDKEVEKSEDEKEEDEAEKSAEPEAGDEKEEEAEKSDEEEKDEEKKEEEAEKSVEPALGEILGVVLKSYSQIIQEVSVLRSDIEQLTQMQQDVFKSLDTPTVVVAEKASVEEGVIEAEEVLSKAIASIPELPAGEQGEVAEKSVGYLEKSNSFTEEEETFEKSASNIETVPAPEVTEAEIDLLFKSKYAQAIKSVTSARDENHLREVTQAWQRLTNGRATDTDTTLLNTFLNN